MLAQILIVIIVAIAITALAERRNIQPALLVAMVGLVVSFIPAVPRLELEPHIILGLVLPPMLFSAARDFSFTSFARRFGSIFNLGVLMVVVTTGFVALVAAGLVPELTLAGALVLAAVIAPPDAVTAITIGRKAGLPTALMTVLKGESLINDAAALTLVAAAVAAVAGTPSFIENLALYFLYSSLVGIVLGLMTGNFAQFARRKLANPSLATAVSVLVPFAAYLIAEELHASGVLAVVAAGFALGHHSIESGYEERMQERQFWRTLDTLLETFVFAYIGLQLRFVITDAIEAGIDLWSLFGAAIAIFLATVAIRFAWVFATVPLARWRYRNVPDRQIQLKRHADRLARLDGRKPKWSARQKRIYRGDPPPPPPLQPPLSWKENIVLSWTGMRGVVTLAAAAGIPVVTATGEDFPGREVILALAFLVTIATLLIQGLTLPWLIKTLDLTDPNDARFEAEQQALARGLAQEAMAGAIDTYRASHPGPSTQKMVEFMQQRNNRTAETGVDQSFDRNAALELGRDLLEARRQRLIAARDAQEIDDSIVRETLEHMDLEQAFMDMNSKRSGGSKEV